MALTCGADLVLELPCVFSSCNAGIFANAAVDILAAAGIVDFISFGMESDPSEINIFAEIADTLNDEPAGFKESMKKFLTSGYSFVMSRSLALDEFIPGAADVLKSPNNNLALAYINRIREKNYQIEPIAIKRTGASFHDKDIVPGEIASAAAIRELIAKQDLNAVPSLMPAQSADILMSSITKGHAVTDGGRLWRAVKQMILRADTEELAAIAEMREGFENRMRECAYRADSFDSFADLCTSRRYPKGRVQRYAMHLMLNLRHETCRNFQKNGPAYIRMLGANEKGRKLLGRMRDTATLPLLSRAGGDISLYANEIMQFEHRATEIWETLTDSPRIAAESRLKPVLV
jgi:predicted nucleotidyltransferase